MIKLVVPALALMLAGTAGAQTIDRVLERNELRLGYRTDAAPMSYQTDDGRPAGYTPLLCTRVAQAFANSLEADGLDVQFVPVTTENRFDLVATGEIDLLCGAASITMSRREVVDFSIPVFVDGTAVMLPLGAERTMDALSGKTIGVRSATTTEEALGNTLTQTGVEAEVVTFDDHDAAMDAMVSGDISAYFADQSILLFLNARRNGGQDFQVMDRLLTIEKQGLAMARGDTEMRYLVDGILSGLYANGTMRKIFDDTLSGASPGEALKALYLTAPILP